MSVISVNDQDLTMVELHVPHRGCWWAKIELVEDPDLEGSVTIVIDELRLVGAVVPSSSGTFGNHRRALVFGGAAGWGTELPPRHYRSDTGVRARLVVDDAVRAAGETLGTFEPGAERMGPHYARNSGLARRVLEDAIGSALWWVDYEGITHVAAERPAVETAEDDYRVLDFDPLEGLATLEVQDPRTVVVGSVLTEGLDEPQTVRELDLTASADGLRMQVWTGTGRYGRAESQAYAVHRRFAERHMWGSWRYRVQRMNGDKLDARPVRADRGLPDLVAVELSPGIPGADADLVDGTEVLVEFVEGDRSLPRVVAFAGRDQGFWAPTILTLDAGTRIDIGAGAADEVALSGLVEAELAKILSAIVGATVVPGDGGAKLKADIITALAGFPGSVAATKVRAE